MKLFLDSSAIIELFANNKEVIDSIEKADEVYTSSLCSYEVLMGERFSERKGIKSHYKEASAFFDSAATLPFTHDDSKTASDIMATLSLKGRKVPDMDILIAAQALDRKCTILTKDARHFAIIGKETNLGILTF
ncbi:MAG: type II toxin-antitoxin system VapC family toxin [Thermoplasmata archaeon]|nr:type II toxin-antitoxin system VapC family toxin [Candidatus Sysuiplasma acidicola]